MSSDSDPSETLSLPSIAIVTILGYLIYRYFFSSSSTASTSGSVSGSSGQRYRFTATQVDTVSNMFPQLSRRDIMWDLHRNGGSVQATTERILGGRGLETAPPSFQPNIGTPTPTPGTQMGGLNGLLRNATKKEEIDLITRYNLQGRVKSSDKGKAREDSGTNTNVDGSTGTGTGTEGSATQGTSTGAGTGTMGWAATKDARQSILQRRRDEMILEARRKMLERDAQGGGDGAATRT